MVAMAMAVGCYKAGRDMAEVWQSEEGSSRGAEPQGSDEKKLPKFGSFQLKRRACERMRLIRIFEIAKPPTIQTTAKPIMK